MMALQMDFAYEAAAGRVVFGAGRAAELGAELDRLGRSRVLLLSTPGQRDLAARIGLLAGGRVAGHFHGAEPQVPRSLVARAEAQVRALSVDGLLPIGGGSTIGLAKGLALATGLPTLAVPTTYSGSEMTRIWGLTEGGEKATGRDLVVRPRTVIYDPLLTLGLPPRTSAESGINAMAHAVEALYAADANPVTSLQAEEALRALAASLPRVVAAPDDAEARSEALYGAWLAGLCLDTVAMGLHHKLCHVLGGSFDLPHAAVHAVVLPHALAYNAPAVAPALVRAARALGSDDPPAAIQALERRLGVPTSLAAIGMKEADLPRALELALARPYPNPRPLERDGLSRLLEAAFVGAPASAPATAARG